LTVHDAPATLASLLGPADPVDGWGRLQCALNRSHHGDESHDDPWRARGGDARPTEYRFEVPARPVNEQDLTRVAEHRARQGLD